jgi:phosphoribosyl 1,2-cyclic phosphodiesterase
MFVRPIASSSNGNSTYVYNDDTHIIVDSGIAAKDIIKLAGRHKFDAILITHNHSDHFKSAGPLGRKTKAPIYILSTGYKAKKDNLFKCKIVEIDPTQSYKIGSIVVQPFSTSHDVLTGSVGFTFQDKSTKFCFITDTGRITKLMYEQLMQCNSYFLETDYDEALVKTCDYPELLKERIQSDAGHLSNQQAIEFFKLLDLNKVKSITVGHLSKNNNSPDIVKKLFEDIFPNYISKLHIAPTSYDIEV